jgi:F-type H+-transporting ATPase subunit b
MTFLRQLAAETTESSSDIFTALGIDWRLLILQIVAFLILVFLLGKFMYPWLMKSVDERQANIEAASKAATAAQKAAEESKERVAHLLAEAREEASEIVSTAKLEAANMLETTEKKAKKSAERIVAEAQEQLDKDVERVKKELYNETLELVGLATEKVIGSTLTAKADKELIVSAVKGSK